MDGLTPLKRVETLRDELTHINAELTALETRRNAVIQLIADTYERLADDYVLEVQHETQQGSRGREMASHVA